MMQSILVWIKLLLSWMSLLSELLIFQLQCPYIPLKTIYCYCRSLNTVWRSIWILVPVCQLACQSKIYLILCDSQQSFPFDFLSWQDSSLKYWHCVSGCREAWSIPVGWILGAAGAACGASGDWWPQTELKWTPPLWAGVGEGSGKALGEAGPQRSRQKVWFIQLLLSQVS